MQIYFTFIGIFCLPDYLHAGSPTPPDCSSASTKYEHIFAFSSPKSKVRTQFA